MEHLAVAIGVMILVTGGSNHTFGPPTHSHVWRMIGALLRAGRFELEPISEALDQDLTITNLVVAIITTWNLVFDTPGSLGIFGIGDTPIVTFDDHLDAIAAATIEAVAFTKGIQTRSARIDISVGVGVEIGID